MMCYKKNKSFVVDIINPKCINISHTEVGISPSNSNSLPLGGKGGGIFYLNDTIAVSRYLFSLQLTVVVRMAVSLW